MSKWPRPIAIHDHKRPLEREPFLQVFFTSQWSGVGDDSLLLFAFSSVPAQIHLVDVKVPFILWVSLTWLIDMSCVKIGFQTPSIEIAEGLIRVLKSRLSRTLNLARIESRNSHKSVPISRNLYNRDYRVFCSRYSLCRSVVAEQDNIRFIRRSTQVNTSRWFIGRAVIIFCRASLALTPSNNANFSCTTPSRTPRTRNRIGLDEWM